MYPSIGSIAPGTHDKIMTGSMTDGAHIGMRDDEPFFLGTEVGSRGSGQH